MKDRMVRTGVGSVLALVLALGTVSTALAGGFAISVDSPANATDPRLKNAALILKPVGCIVPAQARLSARAEGIVNGRRRTIPLRLDKAGPALYGLRQQWPKEGHWLVVASGLAAGRTTHVLIRTEPGGKVAFPQTAKAGRAENPNVRHVYVEGEVRGVVESTLRQMAARPSGRAKTSKLFR